MATEIKTTIATSNYETSCISSFLIAFFLKKITLFLALKLSDFILLLFFKLSYLSLANRRRTTICNSHEH